MSMSHWSLLLPRRRLHPPSEHARHREVEEEHELDQIRKYKYSYHKRRQAEEAEWQQEVKREI